jgi:hypothetical protein
MEACRCHARKIFYLAAAKYFFLFIILGVRVGLGFRLGLGLRRVMDRVPPWG